ncbi:unnamed protein product [Bursaphelenchus xylophilus]|uniref:(pine wood nematode) hypothetical protein n=1 Tax=Bursaphelenchus xylophilus TaxID=6326 RepID=A0A1I7RM62_BURXY|nr:unnamed protein product [Bursaphelenchus xylophilus]CAG9118235.1 unnamed protein product [Bursaphelenchus xylophilus]
MKVGQKPALRGSTKLNKRRSPKPVWLHEAGAPARRPLSEQCTRASGSPNIADRGAETNVEDPSVDDSDLWPLPELKPPSELDHVDDMDDLFIDVPSAGIVSAVVEAAVPAPLLSPMPQIGEPLEDNVMHELQPAEISVGEEMNENPEGTSSDHWLLMEMACLTSEPSFHSLSTECYDDNGLNLNWDDNF